MIKRSFRLLCSAGVLPAAFVVLGEKAAFAAACCGGGFAAPAMIVGDDKAQVTTSYGYSRVADDVGTDSLWRKRESLEASETLKIDAAHIFADRWQGGISVPVVRRQRAGSESTGFGDVAGSLGYEYLPDWDYNPWRPHGYGFLQIVLPTGKSINEADGDFQLDSRGRGFWAVGAGTILTKTLGKWDVFTSVDVHRSFDKKYENAQSSGTLKPGYGGTIALGAGYNLEVLRFGGALAGTYEDAIDVDGSAASRGAVQRSATGSLSASYLFQDDYTATIAYSDQTVFGTPFNTTLGRGATVFVQKRWLR